MAGVHAQTRPQSIDISQKNKENQSFNWSDLYFNSPKYQKKINSSEYVGLSLSKELKTPKLQDLTINKPSSTKDGLE